MALSEKDALEAVMYLGVTAENLDDFKKKFDSDFIKKERIVDDKELLGKMFGRKIGELETIFDTHMKKTGIEFDAGYNDLRLEQRIEKVAGLISDKHKKEVESLQSQVKGDGGAALKEWENKYNKLESKYNQTNELFEKTKGEVEGIKLEYATKEKQAKISGHFTEQLGKLKFHSKVDELQKDGFLGRFNSKYEHDTDDKGNIFLKSKETGKRIPSKKQAGAFMDTFEVLEEEAATFNLLTMTPTQQNNGGQNNNGQTYNQFGIMTNQSNNQNTNQGNGQPIISNKAIKAAEEKAKGR